MFSYGGAFDERVSGGVSRPWIGKGSEATHLDSKADLEAGWQP